MTLCELCRSIPLDENGLQPLPAQFQGSRPPWRYIHEFRTSTPVIEPIGLLFHRSLMSLKLSANDCPLCCLVLSAIKKTIQELEDPDKEELRRDMGLKIPTWKLWLTKRGYGNGFYVFTECEDSDNLALVAAIGLCVEEGGTFQSLYDGRPLEQNPGTHKTMARIKQWIEKCNDHPNCAAAPPPLPARIIDVGNKDDGYHLRLREVENENGAYTCLSHCWGKANHFTTTKATLAAHKTNINFDHLPETFKNAISVTRTLGVSYIWIDSLCIVQDDSGDWQRESARMTGIYMNSYLTIAASAAKDSSVGCFVSRKAVKYVAIPCTTSQGVSGELQAFILPLRKEAMPDLYLQMADHIGKPDHPLVTRAWAVQERALPRRSLHFGKHQIYLECQEGFQSENGLKLPWRYQSMHFNEQNRLGREIDESQNDTREVWRDLLRDYGTRNLTMPSDKLPAISGLAKLFAERLDDEYVAGLWRKSLLEDLLWQGLGVHRLSKYRAPSWSWASVDGFPAMSRFYKAEPLAEILDYNIDLVDQNFFGQVKAGWLKVQAPLVPLVLDEGVYPRGTRIPYYENDPKVRTELGDPTGTYSSFDFDEYGPNAEEEALAILESLRGVDIFALIIAKTCNDDDEEDENEEQYRSLLIRRAERNSSAMLRLGTIDFDPKGLGECSQLEHPEQRPTVTLI